MTLQKPAKNKKYPLRIANILKTFALFFIYFSGTVAFASKDNGLILVPLFIT